MSLGIPATVKSITMPNQHAATAYKLNPLIIQLTADDILIPFARISRGKTEYRKSQKGGFSYLSTLTEGESYSPSADTTQASGPQVTAKFAIYQ
jgi:hypothetical protein